MTAAEPGEQAAAQREKPAELPPAAASPHSSAPTLHFTARGWVLLAVAGLLYLAANQTQVGWLYVMSALAAGAWLAGRWASPAGMLRGLTLVRRVNGTPAGEELELYAGQPATVELELKNSRALPALQVRGTEACPFAAASDRDQPYFIPAIPGHSTARLSYTVIGARRGWFEFPATRLSTQAPFGLFAADRTVETVTQGLVFPEYRELERFPLLDQRPAAENRLAHVGVGGEVLGVREYRPGDSRRHIHWRSSARAGRLIVKEFAEETQPGLTIALDLRASAVRGEGENTSLELAIKIAATLGRYALYDNLPVMLAANSQRWPAPAGPLSWWSLMSYLAVVQAEGDEPFADGLGGLDTSSLVAAIFTSPDDAAAAALTDLQRRGQGALAVVVDPAPFGGPAGQAQALAEQLKSHGVAVRLIGGEPDWERTLVEGDDGGLSA